MEKLSCLIIEDEPLAAEILQEYIAQFTFLELKGTCGHVVGAMEILNTNNIDIIFLDIHLPQIKGIDFIKTLESPPVIIITSAHKQYALDGYALNVADYLLKPIEFSRFETAVTKAVERCRHHAEPNDLRENPHLFFNVNKQKIKIYTSDIIYIESLKEYIKIVTNEKTIITKFPMIGIEARLSKQEFIRTHRSFIVAKAKVDAISATGIQIGNFQIPIGRSYKANVSSCFNAAK